MKNLIDPLAVCGRNGSSCLTPADLAALREAVELAEGVVHRHPMQVTGQALTALAAIQRDVAALAGHLGAVAA